MFFLQSLNLSYFDASKVTVMNSNFYGCYSLTYLSVYNFNRSKIPNMNDIFHVYSSLTFLNISKFNSKNVKKKFKNVSPVFFFNFIRFV